MREVLIAPVMGHRDDGSWSILRALAMTSLLLLVTLSAVRYESKINRLEARLEILETESILKEALGLQVKVSDLMGGEIKFMDNPVSEVISGRIISCLNQGCIFSAVKVMVIGKIRPDEMRNIECVFIHLQFHILNSFVSTLTLTAMNKTCSI